MHELDIAWAAGFFDGEGCIQIRKSKTGNKMYYTLLVSIDNTDPRPLLDLKRIMGGVTKLKGAQSIHSDTWENRSVWRWAVMSKQAELILRSLLPYLRNKKEEAELALLYRETLVGPKGYKGFDEESVIKIREKLQQLKVREWYPWWEENTGDF